MTTEENWEAEWRERYEAKDDGRRIVTAGLAPYVVDDQIERIKNLLEKAEAKGMHRMATEILGESKKDKSLDVETMIDRIISWYSTVQVQERGYHLITCKSCGKQISSHCIVCQRLWET